jgi:hypothetical protein
MAAAAQPAYRRYHMPVRISHLIRRVLSWPRRVVVTVTVIALLLLTARVASPLVAKHLVNQHLEQIPGYTGHVNSIGLDLWRGAYSLHGFVILRKNGKVQEPFFRAKHIYISLAWRELWHRKIVSNIDGDEVQLSIVKGPSADESQTDLDNRWQAVIHYLFPLNVTHLVITDGFLRYVDITRQPNVNVFVTHVRATSTGLRNRLGEGHSGEFPAEIAIEGESIGGGKLKILLEAEPLAIEPHFHLSLKVDNVNLPELNESLESYAHVAVSRGTFHLVGEIAGCDGGFQGYVKPFFEDLDFKNLEGKEKGIGSWIWARLVATAVWTMKDKSRDQLATRIPFEGSFGDTKVGTFTTITNLFRHGFLHAFKPTVENSVHADNVLPSGKSADGKDVGKNLSDKKLEKMKKPDEANP